MKPIVLDDEFSYPLHSTGSISLMPVDAIDDPVAKLHAIVKEVTGKDVEVAPRPRIGFLP
jgi:hypothetical protein